MIKFRHAKVLLLHKLLVEQTDEEVVDVGLRLAEGKMQYEGRLQWIKMSIFARVSV